MIKCAYNKTNTNLVFEIDRVDRVAIGDAGVKEVYVGTLTDTSTNPDTVTANYQVQVSGFEMDWTEVPTNTYSDPYVLPPATSDTLGGVKIGGNVSVNDDGTISVAAAYTLPEASDEVLGGIKVGSGLSITDGVLSATGGGSSIVELDITGQYDFTQESVGNQTAITLTAAQIQAFKDLAGAMGEGSPYPNTIPFYLKYYGQAFNPVYYQYNAFTSKLLIYIVFSNGIDIIHRELEFDVTHETLKYIDRLFEEQNNNNNAS